jgi:hypothetical protein
MAMVGCKKDKPKETSDSEPVSSVMRGVLAVDAPASDTAVPKECEKLCGVTGKCVLRDGKCYANSPQKCALSYACKIAGLCQLKDERCVALTDADCQRSEMCGAQGACVAVNGKCENVSQPSTSASAVPAK